MHWHGRPFAFNEQNIAAVRKLMTPGPLPLWSSSLAVAPSASSRNKDGPTNISGEGEASAGSSSRKERPGPGNATAKVVRTAAVLIPLCNRDGVASMLFTVRTSKVSTYKGQVSFPGGHIEAGEGPIEAALRETREEIGTSIGHVEVLGTCQTLPTVTGTLVTPVLAFLREDVGARLPDLILSKDEVDSVFTLSVTELLDPAFRMKDDLGLRGKLPAFTAGPIRVWGLTALMTEGVLQRAILPWLNSESGRTEHGEGATRPEADRFKGTDVSSLCK